MTTKKANKKPATRKTVKKRKSGLKLPAISNRTDARVISYLSDSIKKLESSIKAAKTQEQKRNLNVILSNSKQTLSNLKKKHGLSRPVAKKK